MCLHIEPYVPAHRAVCALNPTSVCPQTQPGFAKSDLGFPKTDLGFGKSEVGAPMIQDRIVFAPPQTKAW
jgi:hypothetical protein